MKCKYCLEKIEYIGGNEYIEVFHCFFCGAIALMSIEIIEKIKWYKEDK